ncbi:hypothetical protein PRIPAC_95626 [Pristionchus pacificus]|uniref:Ribosomal protein n=1 Tax=Pristionchus pacificus TaxID=54126 RepID=A0A2A6D278_PRIPA|nr:hypothetical protein PRIPAC_95626 [Pristionchus pacificus]|eukprot:PDM84515.1 ribosomal protein [Pristionchus pacificus]
MPTRAKGEVLHEYIVIGLLTEKEPVTPIYKMQTFASNAVIAKSRFWYFISMLRRLKKANGEILECKESVLLNLRTSFPVNDTDSLDNSYGSAEGIHGRFQSSADVENDYFPL